MAKLCINKLTAALDIARSLLFPPRCVGCGELLPPFAKTPAVFCPLCRTAWESAVAEAAAESAADASRGLVYLVRYRPGHTDGVPEKLIYHVKHVGDGQVFRFLAERLAPRLLSAAEALPTRAPAGEDRPFLFTYPPRRRSAVSEDGFDQAKRLAKALTTACSGEVAPLIRRTHRGKAEQKMLDAEGRAQNAASAYVLAAGADELLRDRTVVICDDLCTTGATLNRCAALLVAAGARSVILCTVARTGRAGKEQD